MRNEKGPSGPLPMEGTQTISNNVTWLYTCECVLLNAHYAILSFILGRLVWRCTEPNSLLDYVRCELRRGYVLQNDEQRYRERREKFYIFLQIPCKLETFLLFGFFQCVDAFLFVITFLPFRFLLACILLTFRCCRFLFRLCLSANHLQTFQLLNPAEKCDLMKGIIIVVCAYMMNGVDTSYIYHLIKSQSVIKLYIFFNMLEVADKLMSSFGQDILDTLYWTATEPPNKKRHYMFIVFHFAFAILYVFGHSMLVLLQATTLNVAINSKNKALLTVMMSNNFVELKSMVFKKFEKNNLFHMSCSDVRERFHYIMLLMVVIIQTMKEYAWSDKQFWILFPDCLMVLLAEIFVDWFKHAFVTRFNEISEEVYEDYSLSLAYDLVGSKLKSAFSDHSDIVSRRMGFIPLPLSVLAIRIFSTSFTVTDAYSCLCLLFAFLCLITFKLAVNIVLLGVSCQLIDQRRRNLQEKVNKVLGGQSASLPASRHNSVTDLTILTETDKAPVERINGEAQEWPPTKSSQVLATSKAIIGTGIRSTPHSPNSSTRNSLEDISKQVAILQDTLESSIIFSDSTVSLISMNDGQDVHIPEQSLPQKENIFNHHKHSQSRKRLSVLNANLKRRVSLQELPNNVDIGVVYAADTVVVSPVPESGGGGGGVDCKKNS